MIYGTDMSSGMKVCILVCLMTSQRHTQNMSGLLAVPQVCIVELEGLGKVFSCPSHSTAIQLNFPGFLLVVAGQMLSFYVFFRTT